MNVFCKTRSIWNSFRLRRSFMIQYCLVFNNKKTNVASNKVLRAISTCDLTAIEIAKNEEYWKIFGVLANNFIFPYLCTIRIAAKCICTAVFSPNRTEKCTNYFCRHHQGILCANSMHGKWKGSGKKYLVGNQSIYPAAKNASLTVFVWHIFQNMEWL